MLITVIVVLLTAISVAPWALLIGWGVVLVRLDGAVGARQGS
jgi:hypothetical protein